MQSIATHTPSTVCSLDEQDPGAGGACHTYAILVGSSVQHLQFQHGPRLAPNSTPGAFDDDLLAILQDRLEDFQAGPFQCPENAEALGLLQRARQALGRRVAARAAQGVLGKNEHHKPA